MNYAIFELHMMDAPAFVRVVAEQAIQLLLQDGKGTLEVEPKTLALAAKAARIEPTKGNTHTFIRIFRQENYVDLQTKNS